MHFFLLIISLLLCNCNRKDVTSPRNELNSIVQYLKPKLNGSFHEDIDIIRDFINSNSEHRSTDNFVLPPEDVATMSLEVWKAFKNPGYIKPNLYCGHRANLMIAVLKEFGFKARYVNIMSDNYSSLMGHIFPEVLNPQTKVWEINDPDYNIYYINNKGLRIGVMELLFDNVDNISACTKLECGIRPEGREDIKILIDNFFEGAWIGTNIYLNSKKFDVNKRFADKGNKTLFEYLAEHDEKYFFYYQKEINSSHRK